MAEWQNYEKFSPHTFVCGFCEKEVSSREGYRTGQGFSAQQGFPIILVCPGCNKPTYFYGAEYVHQIPAPVLGGKVEALPQNIQLAYKEARECTKVNAYTASVLLCRKLLMYIAVEQGADAGKSFLYYVEFLADQGYVPPNGRLWVDHIRRKGNEATHEIVVMTKDDASDLLTFSEMLLKFIYEFPAKITNSDSETHTGNIEAT